MRIGINEWTTFPASFDEELSAYRAAGAGAIGILEFKLDGVDDVDDGTFGDVFEDSLWALPAEIARRAVESMEAL